jgi:hypothetical protein
MQQLLSSALSQNQRTVIFGHPNPNTLGIDPRVRIIWEPSRSTQHVCRNRLEHWLGSKGFVCSVTLIRIKGVHWLLGCVVRRLSCRRRAHFDAIVSSACVGHSRHILTANRNTFGSTRRALEMKRILHGRVHLARLEQSTLIITLNIHCYVT